MTIIDRQFAKNNPLFNIGVLLMIFGSGIIALIVCLVNRIGEEKIPLYGFTFTIFLWGIISFSILRSLHFCLKLERLTDIEKKLKIYMISVGACLLLTPFGFWWDVSKLSGFLPMLVTIILLAMIGGHFLFYISLLKRVTKGKKAI